MAAVCLAVNEYANKMPDEVELSMQLKKRISLRSLFVGAILSILFSVSYATQTSERSPGSLALNQELAQRLSYWQKHSAIPGLQMSVSLYGDGYIRDYVAGEADLIKQRPLAPYDLMGIGSTTKSFTSALILLAEKEGKLTITDTLADTTKTYGKWLPVPYYQQWHTITIKQLLNMTSGIYSYTEDGEFNRLARSQPKRIWSTNDILKITLRHSAYFKPGKGWHYSDTNYIILGLLLEKVYHTSLNKLLQNKLLGAENGNLLYTFYPDFKRDNYVPYPASHGYTSKNRDVSDINMSQAGAAGALYSTSHDINKWIRALLTGQILPAKQTQELLTPVDRHTGKTITHQIKKNGYALGLLRVYYSDRGGVNWIYFGGTSGFMSYYNWSPCTGTLISIVANQGMDDENVTHPSAAGKYLSRYIPNDIYNTLLQSDYARASIIDYQRTHKLPAYCQKDLLVN